MSLALPEQPGQELAPLDHGLALTAHARITSYGLEVGIEATEAELLDLVAGLGAINDAACFAVGDMANFYREHYPAQYRDWIDRPSPVKGLDSKTVKIYAAVCAFYPHDQRARHMLRYAGHPGVSFSHFSRLRRLGQEQAEYWLEQAATNGWSMNDLEERLQTEVIGADEVPAVAGDPIVQYGESFWLGPPEDPQRHLVLCGDATDPAHLALIQHMGDTASMMWTDPPYGVSYESIGDYNAAPGQRLAAGERPIENDALDETQLLAFLRDSFLAAKGALDTSAPVYIASPSGDLGAVFVQAMKLVGWEYKQGCVWLKQRITFGRSDYHYRHETIHYGTTAGDVRVGRMPNRVKWYGGDNASSVFEASVSMDNSDHPTQKPIALIKPAIENSSQAGEIVLDPFAGSGSTLIAADLVGRRCFAIEKSPVYVDTIRARYDKWLVTRAQGLVIEQTQAEVVAPADNMPVE